MILKDNKILTNYSGEILKTPPIIDISSDYGVTKDGSNLVSKVRNRYNANVFRAPSGKEPVENGDGFEFAGGTDLLSGLELDYIENNVIEIWYKITTGSTGHKTLWACYDLSDSSSYFYARINSVSGVMDLSGAASGAWLNAINIGTANSLVENVWTHYVCYLDFSATAGTASVYIGGKAYMAKYMTIKTPSMPNIPFTLGNIYNHNAAWKGSLSGVKVANQRINLLINGTGTGTYNYAANTQVFTPPTFPNTIL